MRGNPNGRWQSETGMKYDLTLKDQELTVTIVPGSNAKFLEYEVKLSRTLDINTYEGKGYFVVKLGEGKEIKECRFETHWKLVIASEERLVGATDLITPEGQTCEVKDRTQGLIDMQRVAEQTAPPSPL